MRHCQRALPRFPAPFHRFFAMTDARHNFTSNQEPFESPKDLVDGAEERITELETLVKTSGESCDYEIVTHTDPKTKEKVVKLRLKQRFPTRIRTLASGIIKEMRLALDQAFCEAAIELGRSDAKDIYFPFGKSIEDLNREVQKKCRGVDERLVRHCLLSKPHFGAGSDGLLWSMSSLAGKVHRASIGAGFHDTTSFGEAITYAKGPLKIIINKWNDLHNELEVARLPEGSELHVKKDFRLRLQIIFAGDTHAMSYRPLVETLRKLHGIVCSIVLGIEAETARLLRERAAP
jgi:hypothetical protein